MTVQAMTVQAMTVQAMTVQGLTDRHEARPRGEHAPVGRSYPNRGRSPCRTHDVVCTGVGAEFVLA
jgi:hypothetical protein